MLLIHFNVINRNEDLLVFAGLCLKLLNILPWYLMGPLQFLISYLVHPFLKVIFWVGIVAWEVYNYDPYENLHTIALHLQLARDVDLGCPREPGVTYQLQHWSSTTVVDQNRALHLQTTLAPRLVAHVDALYVDLLTALDVIRHVALTLFLMDGVYIVTPTKWGVTYDAKIVAYIQFYGLQAKPGPTTQGWTTDYSPGYIISNAPLRVPGSRRAWPNDGLRQIRDVRALYLQQ